MLKSAKIFLLLSIVFSVSMVYLMTVGVTWTQIVDVVSRQSSKVIRSHGYGIKDADLIAATDGRKRESHHDTVCVSECCDPFQSRLYKQVAEDNCTRYRWVTIPDDQGRIGHIMSQAYILMVFLKLFEAHKNATGKGKDIIHIPVLPRYKELVLCDIFVRPTNMYTSHDLVKDVCGPEKATPVETSLSTWKADFENLLQHNVLLNTWPMPVMHLKENTDVFCALFNLHPALEQQAQKLLLHILNQRKKVVSEKVTFIAMHVRRTDYVEVVELCFPDETYNASTIEALMDYAQIKYKNALFVLFSDDEAWCQENLRQRNNLVITSSPRPELSMAVMKQCNVTIVTYGSFGLWAGILGGGPMIRLMARSENRLRRMQNTEETLSDVKFFYYPKEISVTESSNTTTVKALVC